jgi:hypothetical protein
LGDEVDAQADAGVWAEGPGFGALFGLGELDLVMWTVEMCCKGRTKDSDVDWLEDAYDSLDVGGLFVDRNVAVILEEGFCLRESWIRRWTDVCWKDFRDMFTSGVIISLTSCRWSLRLRSFCASSCDFKYDGSE